MNTPEPEHEPMVTRIRVSHVSAVACADLEAIGGPVAFARRLVTLEPVRGLAVTLPFGHGLPVETGFWSRVSETEDRLTAPVAESLAPRLRKAGVPLRARGSLTLDAPVPGPPQASPEVDPVLEVPRLEAHLRPFGVVVIATVDVVWPTPVPVSRTWPFLGRLEDASATAGFDTPGERVPFGAVAETAARALITRLSTSSSAGLPHEVSVRVLTVIEGQPEVLGGMPAANSPLHVALHRLSGGPPAIAAPATAFVPQWTGGSYAWPTSNLIYLLDRGATLLPNDAEGRVHAGDAHRQLTLLTAFLAALTGLVRAAPGSGSELFAEWAQNASKHLGRLFGPGAIYADWGLVPRAFLQRVGAAADVAVVLGVPLTPSDLYPVEEYT